MSNPDSKVNRTSFDQGLISVLVPCYNEAEVLPLLFARLSNAAQQWGLSYEVIVVDDGSQDDTWSLLSNYHIKDARWKAIRLARNFGHQVALWACLKHAHGDVIVVLDADLQDPPEDVSKLLDKWKEGYDIVYAVRHKRKESGLKVAAYYCYYRILAFLAEIDVPLDSGDFCVMDRKVVRAMTTVTEQQPFVRGLRAWVGFRQIGVSCERDRRAAGEVKYTFRKLSTLALNGIVSYSTRPLRLATLFGFLVSGMAFVGTIFTFLQRIFSHQFEVWGMPYVPGFASTLIAILFIGGVQLVCVGILGEYVGRIYDNVRGRPQFTVSEAKGLEVS